MDSIFNNVDFDPYYILGVNQDDSPSYIKKKYYKLAMTFHPDKYKSKSEADREKNEVRFKNVSKAYSILSDKQKKKIYDNYKIVVETQEDIDDIKISSSLFDGIGGYCHSRGNANVDINDPEFFVQSDDIIGEIYNIMDNNLNFMNNLFRYEMYDSKINQTSQYNNDLTPPVSSNVNTSGDVDYQEVSFKRYICRARLEDIYTMKRKYIYIRRKIDNCATEKIKLYIDTSQQKCTYREEKAIVKIVDRPHDHMRRFNKYDIIFDYPIKLIDAYRQLIIKFKHLDGNIYKIRFEPLIQKSQTMRVFKLLNGKGFPKKIHDHQGEDASCTDIKRGDLYIKFVIKLPKNL